MSASLSSHHPAAILWDMDGTIVDTEPYWILAETEIAQSFGASWGHEDGLAVVGQGLPFTATRLQERGVALDLDVIIQTLTSRVLEQLEGSIPWRPGAPELLSELQELGIEQALVTMSIERMASRMAELIPGTPMSVIVSGDHVLRSKPDPEAYLLAAKRLGVNIEECVALEDSPSGCVSAHDAGAVTIGIPHMVSLENVPMTATLPSLLNVNAEQILSIYAKARK